MVSQDPDVRVLLHPKFWPPLLQLFEALFWPKRRPKILIFHPTRNFGHFWAALKQNTEENQDEKRKDSQCDKERQEEHEEHTTEERKTENGKTQGPKNCLILDPSNCGQFNFSSPQGEALRQKPETLKEKETNEFVLSLFFLFPCFVFVLFPKKLSGKTRSWPKLVMGLAKMDRGRQHASPITCRTHGFPTSLRFCCL